MKRISIAVVAFAASCVASPEPSSEPQDTNGELTVYTQTIVTKKEDGTLEVTSKPITLAEEIAENKIREASAAGEFVPVPYHLDPGCAGASDWLYDQPKAISGFVGNRICFNHPSLDCNFDDLTQFARVNISCGGGVVVTLRWAGGVFGCPFMGVSNPVPNNLNFVRSIWTGNPGGVTFLNDSSIGPVQGSYVGNFVQYPDVSTSGRYVRTCGPALK
jgi:hypothetical protein